MKKTMLLLTALLAAAFAAALLWCGLAPSGLGETLAITFGTCFYHFAMRLLVGCGLNAVFHNRMNPYHPWFRPRKWEKGLYKALRVKRWKKHVPAWVPESFDLKTSTPRDIAAVTCQAELVHEVIMVLSFLPLTVVPVFGAFWVFLITSIAACMVDSVFVILQRFNRPRLVRYNK